MLNFLKSLVDTNARELKRLSRIVTEINNLEDKARTLKDSDFPKETNKLKDRIKNDQTQISAVLPWAYALVREASRRVLGERHFDVQLLAGIALHEGNIAEQKTGEGKTLSATAPLYLNALTGKGAHLVTVNDYLARRDAGWMGMVFDFLGMSTSAIISEQSYIYDREHFDTSSSDWRITHLRSVSRKEAYMADITYGINSEFGFDYLRDNMVFAQEEWVQRGFNFAIIDEVDSVLIDEARTPHIISAPIEQDTSRYYDYARIVERLLPEVDYAVDEKLKTANLTETGVAKVEKLLGTENMYEKDYDTLFHIEASLKAKALFRLDKDYIVRNNEIVIVDEFTGRLLEGRRFSEGIHQAIEAKENVPIKQESKTLATISLQNYFRMYDKLAGMTGTAATEAEEFHKIYKLNVIVIPTNKDKKRIDNPDYIYKTEKGKFSALVEEIAKEHKIGRPILVGTTSIEKNEILSSLLKRKGIPHELLNAKNHESEASIIAQAGALKAVTIATNMAGRGVDILLGGTPPIKNDDSENNKPDAEKYEQELSQWRKNHEQIVNLGGLYVIGTERHESRRIDNQLRGRAGRQGDPGETRFFISLEDEMVRIFGGDHIGKLMTFFNMPEDQPLEHAMVSKAIEQVQVKVEGFNFDVRKHLLEFDDVLNKHREIIYTQRKRMIDRASQSAKHMQQFVMDSISGLVSDLEKNASLDESQRKEMLIDVTKEIFALTEENQKQLESMEASELSQKLRENIVRVLTEKEKAFGTDIYLQGVKVLYLSTVDHYFTEHLTSIESLREGINLRGYAQLDPLVEYKKEAFTLFRSMRDAIRTDFVRRLVHLEVQPMMDTPQQEITIPANPSELSQKAVSHKKKNGKKGESTKLGRNDPCWCGSGKKWKKCHYPKTR